MGSLLTGEVPEVEEYGDPSSGKDEEPARGVEGPAEKSRGGIAVGRGVELEGRGFGFVFDFDFFALSFDFGVDFFDELDEGVAFTLNLGVGVEVADEDATGAMTPSSGAV